MSVCTSWGTLAIMVPVLKILVDYSLMGKFQDLISLYRQMPGARGENERDTLEKARDSPILL